MIEDPYCLNIPLTTIDKIQIYGDYIVAIGSIFIWILVNICFYIPLWINYCVPLGFLMGASFEYIQPRLGWVYYYKCDAYKIAPMKFMWVIHSIWDSLLLGIILILSYLIWGSSILCEFNIYTGLFMSLLGMIQEIVVECYQTIWYYKPTKWNPTWAVIRGRDMTLQQWHWSILPMIYYYIVVNKLY